MNSEVEKEICANCKKEIPHFNYVMHTAHCARNISLCPLCKEPIPKNEVEAHRMTHQTQVRKIEATDFPRQISKTSSESRIQGRRDYTTNGTTSKPTGATSKQISFGAMPKKVDVNGTSGTTNSFNLKEPNSNLKSRRESAKTEEKSSKEANATYVAPKPNANSLLACKFCDLELPKLDLEEHENYCGSRTDKCNVCGELVMFKYKKIHEDSNHGFLKLKDEPGPRPSWDSNTQRSTEQPFPRRERPPPIYTVESFDFSPLYRSYSHDYTTPNADEKRESYKDISRRLDCKTEYIRNLLHDSASITVPLRRSGTSPRNHFNHNKGPAPVPPHRRPNPPTELTIPCEFCHTPIPHDDLIQHETGCRPDLARFNARRRSVTPEDYYTQEVPSPEVELPCEFCSDMFPASQLLRHQLSCN